jgi:hypothetical protein
MLLCRYVINPKTQNICTTKRKNRINYIKIQKNWDVFYYNVRKCQQLNFNENLKISFVVEQHQH